MSTTLIAGTVRQGLARVLWGIGAFGVLNAVFLGLWTAEAASGFVLLVTVILPIALTVSGLPPLLDLAQNRLRRSLVYLMLIGVFGGLVFGSFSFARFVARGDTGDAFFGATFFMGGLIALGFAIAALLALVAPLAEHVGDPGVSRWAWIGAAFPLILVVVGFAVGHWFMFLLVGLAFHIGVLLYALYRAYRGSPEPRSAQGAPSPAE